MLLEKDKAEFTLCKIIFLCLMDDLQRDVNKVKVLNHQAKSDQIDQTMYMAYWNAKEKLKKLMAIQTPTTTVVEIKWLQISPRLR